MNKTIIVLTFLVLCSALALGGYEAVYNPYTGKLDFIRDVSWNSTAMVYFGNITSLGKIVGNLSWTNLTSYPAACVAGSYVSQLDDSVTCGIPTGTNSAHTHGAPNITAGSMSKGAFTFQDGNLTYVNGSIQIQNATIAFTTGAKGIQLLNASGARYCVTVVGSNLTTTPGACS